MMMGILPDKEQKKTFKDIASKNPDSYFATGILKSQGFERKQCKKCKTYFWTSTGSDICGDPQCQGGFTFIDNTPAKNDLDYIGVWKKFSKLFEDMGYTPIKRYPVVARWRDDTDFVQASIYNFQPHVVSGAVRPPANPLTVPQFSLRFNDIDNVGITGSHYTGFVMIGQHAFMPPDKWNKEKYFEDIHTWLNKGLGLPNNEIIYHEDAWAGGGNFGPCMEFFSRGLELGNQVYMQYEQADSGARELPLRVLDMGMGQERNAWFTKGKTTSYEVTFPTVVKWLEKETHSKADAGIMKKFLHYSSLLNADEVTDMEEAWKKVAKKLNMNSDDLKEEIKPAAALYSIAEHTRTLMIAISDGALPSNVGGGHNLRVILRRALSLQKQYNWDFDFLKLFELHAKYYSEQYPELKDRHENVQKIIGVEMKRHEELSIRNRKIIGRALEGRSIDTQQMIKLYESHGITPNEIQEEAKVRGMSLSIPPNFYAELSESNGAKEFKKTDMRFQEFRTEQRYFDDWKRTDFEAKAIGIIGQDIVLDESYFYPTSGGQLHDKGTISGYEVVGIRKEGNAIVHTVLGHDIKAGDNVKCHIDWERRLQLSQHHTATHVIGTAAKRIIGDHIWQAGAEKRDDKARLDITHYQSLSREEEKEIEKASNEIIDEGIIVSKEFMGRDEAEKKYGFTIYQGGAVPGDVLRIVRIGDIDVQACGGTHLDNTSEIKRIRIIKTTRISDGVVRIEFVAGKAAEDMERRREELLDEVAGLLECTSLMIPGRAEELFSKWKRAKKTKSKEGLLPLESHEETLNDPLEEAAIILQTQEEHLPKTISRFLNDIKRL
jgi:alanyl-tRNA synthetase